MTKLFSVPHQCFSTDHIGNTETLVEADSPDEAVAKYNAVAKERSEYPYCWNQRHDARFVSEPEILR